MLLRNLPWLRKSVQEPESGRIFSGGKAVDLSVVLVIGRHLGPPAGGACRRRRGLLGFWLGLVWLASTTCVAFLRALLLAGAARQQGERVTGSRWPSRSAPAAKELSDFLLT